MTDQSGFPDLTKAAKGKYIQLKGDAPKNCAQICLNLIAELQSAIKDADALGAVNNSSGVVNNGFGSLPNAEALAKVYAGLANGGDSSLKNVLTEHLAVVQDMKDTFIAAGRAYLETEDGTAEAISKAVSEYDSAISNLRAQPPSQW